MDPVLFVLLVIVGIIIIGFVYFDAKRRQVVRQEKRDQKKFEKQFANSQDNAGFDIDGIGEVRLVESAQTKVIQEKIQSNESVNDEVVAATERVVAVDTNEASEEITEPEVTNQEVPVLDDMLFGFNKENLESSNEQKIDPVIEQPSQASLFEDVGGQTEPTVEAEPELIFTLYLVSNNDAPFQGEQLVQALLEQGMRHGDMNIFHRHSQATGRGPVQFSLANAYEPGTFDLNNLDQLHTKGLAVFMALPGPKKPLKAYELMIKTCQALVAELGGHIIDSSKAHFSKQIEAHHKEQIQEFERKLLLKQS